MTEPIVTADPTACAMFTQAPFPFAWCETHDETFPLGAVCPHHQFRTAADAATHVLPDPKEPANV